MNYNFRFEFEFKQHSQKFSVKKLRASQDNRKQTDLHIESVMSIMQSSWKKLNRAFNFAYDLPNLLEVLASIYN